MKSDLAVKLNNKKRIFFEAFIFILLVLIIIFVIAKPLAAKIKETKAQIDAYQLKLEKEYLQAKNIKELSAKIKTVEKKAEELNRVFINENRGLEFVTTLENTADKNNVSQKINLMDGSAVEGSLYKKAPIQLSTQGSFKNQMNYLTDLETLSYYININTLDIKLSAQRAPETEEVEEVIKPDIAMFITGDTYWSQ
ncbi:hypothetical protein COV49_03125 [Candidatus Falkowbacteria bacterium CG11_big_fil_rev_8_21_14_0_20_39_10]|uniref:Uncharacterized protein n=1 Tax=Candidatus Falkowbacteria bacterium CG11_big_fil_rev_8_21_14_0_20_39_10 TaxID=1974570 RepID=A0A2M6K8X8_9BACT|nr:MAG: hypothetical protein COV49_03125 [Candidatus Falkowbacteria bacterium CG11_big_fil_rev_8_21_14_0_20_39_10]